MKYVYLYLNTGVFLVASNGAISSTDAQTLYNSIKAQMDKSSTSGIVEFNKDANGVDYTLSIRASNIVGIQIGDASTNAFTY